MAKFQSTAEHKCNFTSKSISKKSHFFACYSIFCMADRKLNKNSNEIEEKCHMEAHVWRFRKP